MQIAGDPLWRSTARYHLLAALDRVAPHAWLELRERAALPLASGKAAALRGTAERWARGHQIDAPWVIEYALERLRREPTEEALRQTPEIRRYPSNFGWRPIEWAPPARPPKPTPPLEYDPGRMTLEAFEAAVRRHVDEVTAWAREHGATPAPLYRTDPRDFDRLIRWQVLLESPEDIAVSEGTKGDPRDYAANIRKLVKRLAADLELPPRPRGRPGRPRAARNAGVMPK
jgi:hypothetical protein